MVQCVSCFWLPLLEELSQAKLGFLTAYSVSERSQAPQVSYWSYDSSWRKVHLHPQVRYHHLWRVWELPRSDQAGKVEMVLGCN
ncbi:hypothetical protein B0H63DRAFT_486401 [Podospora didyma]|uniref:Uncharacterized protein n=1 Tax=Podospora didyma TaxID=330526 RepID=A0AAE0K5T8_9PEZI|nr:hypothetical protein B0H63DRAFT_486401 [Podospora didyma]